MKHLTKVGILCVLTLGAALMAGCSPGAAADDPVDSLLSTAMPSIVPTEPTPAPVALAAVTTTPRPTELPTAEPPSPTPTVTASATVTPTPTPIDPAAGLPCPVENPVKPVYARGGVGEQRWPPGDSTRTSPHLWLASPLAGEGMPRINRNFPYGSDSNGRYLLHNGLDVIDDPGAPVLAVADGTIIVAGPDDARQFGWRCDWYGNLVALELDQTWDGEPVYVLYGHVLEIGVEAGQRVRQGDPVAVIGVGGVATAPHLHLEVRVGTNAFGATRNPTLWLNPMPGYGTIAGRLVDPDGFPWQGITMTLIDPSGRSEFIYTWTYLDDPDHLINSDEALGENFAYGFIPEGEYDVYTQVQGIEYRRRVEVRSGEIATVEIVTEPFQTPTPGPVETATATVP